MLECGRVEEVGRALGEPWRGDPVAAATVGHERQRMIEEVGEGSSSRAEARGEAAPADVGVVELAVVCAGEAPPRGSP